jgi:diguanylate cyclase (GGDEF)-like protein
MKRPQLRALQGLVLSVGSPLGWLLLQWLDGANPVHELFWNPGVYLYMLFGTALAFAGFGWYVGHREEIELDNALHDPLTGLYNRRYFWRRLEDERAFAQRHGRPLALLVGDIDLFKRVNDTYGHAVGDIVLTAVARCLMQLRRRGDTVARVGGEEFAVILPETDLAEAVRVAERFREAIAQLDFEFDRERYGRFRVTLSFGAAAAEGADILPAAALFQRADAAMYRAKQAGRNRVMMPDMPATDVAAAPAVSVAP